MRRSWTYLVAGVIAVALASAAGPRAAGAESPDATRAVVDPFSTAPVVQLGRSVRGRPIEAVRLGDPSSPNKALVVGVIHGSERAGLRITAALKSSFPALTGVDLWVVDSVNPDSMAKHSRGNSRGVDLNRNFPYRWRPHRRGSGYYSGPRALSERETRVVIDLVTALQPRVTIWYHQPFDEVLCDRGRDLTLQAEYARLAKMSLSCTRKLLPGTAINWQNNAFPGTTGFVVELAAGPISFGAAFRHANAAVEVVAAAFAQP